LKKIAKTDINLVSKEKVYQSTRGEKMEEFIKKEKKMSKRKLALAIFIGILIISVITMFIIYCINSKFRNWVDIKILQKEIKQEDTVLIDFTGDSNSNIYAFDKNIVILENKLLKIYNSSGVEEAAITIDIKNPIFDTAGKYLTIAEKNGEIVYLLKDNKVLWNTTIEGKIDDIEINENGYVGIIISDISYKNIINVFNAEGKSLLKTYVATNKVVDISISKNNQYLAIAEVDMSGVLIQSSIRIIDMIKAKTNPNDSIINTYTAPLEKLITNIEYQNKERLLCVYNDSINVIEENDNKVLQKLENNKITFASVELKNNIVTIEEKDEKEHNSNLCVNITNITNNKTKKYRTAEIAKGVYTYENIIALDLGTELHIINTNGWLMKKYVSEQEINKVVISNKIVGIIHRNKIEIVSL